MTCLTDKAVRTSTCFRISWRAFQGYRYLWDVGAGVMEQPGLCEHAVQLRGGLEAQLGFVEGALAEGRGAAGPVHAAARRWGPACRLPQVTLGSFIRLLHRTYLMCCNLQKPEPDSPGRS